MCGPDPKETAARYRTLVESGIVVPGPAGRMTRASTFAEATEIRRKHPQKITREELMRDARSSAALWHRYYFGVEPRSIVQDWIYRRKLKAALQRAGVGGRR